MKKNEKDQVDFRTSTEISADFLIRHFTTAAFNARHVEKRRTQQAKLEEVVQKFLKTCDEICDPAPAGMPEKDLQAFRRDFAIEMLRHDRETRSFFRFLVDSGLALTVDTRLKNNPLGICGTYDGDNKVLAFGSPGFLRRASAGLCYQIANSLRKKETGLQVVFERTENAGEIYSVNHTCYALDRLPQIPSLPAPPLR